MSSSNAPVAGTAGNAVVEFLKAAQGAQRVTTTAEVHRGQQSGVLRLDHYAQWCTVSDSNGYRGYPFASGVANPTPPEHLWLALATTWSGATLDVSSITVSTTKAPVSGKELKKLAIAAWCELFGVAIPTDDELKTAAVSKRAAKDRLTEKWTRTLLQGSSGVGEWNRQQNALRSKLRTWTKLELPGANLNDLMMVGFLCKAANFAGADLARCQFNGSRFAQADFSGANLTDAQLQGTGLENADLHDAVFAAARMHGASLRKANCKGARFTGAEMNFVDLCGADLTDADLDGATLDKASYDEHTRWPTGFAPTLAMQWKGPGTSPAAHHLAKTRKSKKPLDIEAFMKRLEELTDRAKLAKALQMLKADRFRLYAQVTDDLLVGVVKSQTDASLVYSCKLTGDGVYGCCTQNLNVCGGLRGSLCKHLLVLIVGLARSGELDPNLVDQWVLLSQGQKPVLDKDAMSETFLRYKGAEAGEVDWRPTETIPEDYYAL